MLVELEKVGEIGILRLCRPERANALNQEMLRQLEHLQYDIQSDKSLRVIVTMGAGKGFSAGSDMQELAKMSRRAARRSQTLEGRVCRNFLALPQPTIAAMHGYAMGGGLFLAAYHDFRVVEGSTRLALPEVKLGWNPTFGMQRLIQVVGLAAAMRWLMLGEEFPASDPDARGLVTELVPDGEVVLTVALRLAARLAALPPTGLRAIKRSLWRASGTQFEHTDAIEASIFEEYLDTPEAQASLAKYRATVATKSRKKR